MQSDFGPQKRAGLEELLRWVYANEHSGFYHERLAEVYGDLFPLTPKSWQRVPFLARDDITGTPVWERVMVAHSEVDTLRHTYGSSGKRIIITPKASYGRYDEPYGRFKRQMCFFGAGHNEFPRKFFPQQQVLFGDVGNLTASAKMAAELQIDALFTTPYTALVFAEILERYSGLAQIRFVQLTGERCSPLQYERIKELYPNAVVFTMFSSSETREVVATPCEHDIAAGGSQVLQAAPEVHCEIINPTTLEPVTEAGESGEFVITTIAPNTPFPLIRYRTGDVARYVSRTCACEQQGRGLEILGRWSVFPVRIVKGELTVNAVEAALSRVPHVRSEYFEVHYREEHAEKTALPRVELVLVADADTPRAEVLADRIAKELYVFPTYTYAQGVELGIYLPLKISFIHEAPQGPLGKPKSPSVVRHVAGADNEAPQERATYAAH